MKPIDLVLSKLEALKPTGDSGRQWVGCCPAHPDTIQSLSVGVKDNGNVLLRCFAGCPVPDICASIGIEQKDLFVIREGENVGVTIGTLAFHKRLSPGWLKLCGVRQIPGRNAVEIPYRDANGGELFCRTREHVQAKKGTYQPHKVSLQPYGMWKLDEFRAEGKKTLVLVEGESDCWRLWYHGFPSLGIPGATAVKALHADSLVGFDAVLIWNEPDGGGDSFVKGMTLRLAELGYPGLVKVHKATKDAKDPSDIGAAREATFTTEFQALIDGTPIAGTDAIVSDKPGGMPPCVADAGFTSSPFPWGVHPFTDHGNARRLVALSGEDMLYVDPWERWYVWDGIRWKNDTTLEVERRAARAIHGIWWETHIAPSRTAADLAERWWLSSQSSGRLSSTVGMAMSMVAADYETFDARADLFNADNGTVDLATGEFREAKRDDRLTARCPVKYDPAAECPTWERALDQIFARDPNDPQSGPDTDLVEFVHRLFGCFLTGRTPAILPIFWGVGANGKSVVINVVSKVLGHDYCMSAPNGMLMANASERHPTELADLYGKRVVFSVETNEGQHLNAGLVKQLTGSDRVRARRMREDFWQFTPTHKLVLCTNHKPRVHADDAAIWRRLALVPFRCVFWNPEKQGECGPDHLRQDKELETKLSAESEGILAWLIRGAVAYIQHGLPIPECVTEQTNEYRDGEDIIGQFLGERTKSIKGTRTVKASLYEAYRQWAEKDGYRPVSAKKFGMSMAGKGYHDSQSGSTRYWLDIDLDNADELAKEFDSLT